MLNVRLSRGGQQPPPVVFHSCNCGPSSSSSCYPVSQLLCHTVSSRRRGFTADSLLPRNATHRCTVKQAVLMMKKHNGSELTSRGGQSCSMSAGRRLLFGGFGVNGDSSPEGHIYLHLMLGSQVDSRVNNYSNLLPVTYKQHSPFGVSESGLLPNFLVIPTWGMLILAGL